MKLKIGDWIKIEYTEDWYIIGIVSSLTEFDRFGNVESLWIIPKEYNSESWSWVREYIGANYNGGLPVQVSQRSLSCKIRKLTDDEIMVEML